MASYVTTKCPKCGHVFEFMKHGGDTLKLGIPYHVCPVCKQLLIKQYDKEIIQVPDYKFRHTIRTIVGSSAMSFFIGMTIYIVLGQQKDNVFLPICVGVILFFVLMKSGNSNFEKELNASITRLKNPNYVDTLIKLNLLNKRDILTFKEKYSDIFDEISTPLLEAFIISTSKKENKNQNNTDINTNSKSKERDIKDDSLYELEHKVLRDNFYSEAKKLIDNIIKDSEYVFNLYSSLCEKSGLSVNHNKHEFSIKTFRLNDNQIAFKLLLPKPSRAPLCESIYLVVDSKCEPINYFTFEKNMIAIEPILCSWDKKQNHLNYGNELSFEERFNLGSDIDITNIASFVELVNQLYGQNDEINVVNKLEKRNITKQGRRKPY